MLGKGIKKRDRFELNSGPVRRRGRRQTTRGGNGMDADVLCVVRNQMENIHTHIYIHYHYLARNSLFNSLTLSLFLLFPYIPIYSHTFPLPNYTPPFYYTSSIIILHHPHSPSPRLLLRPSAHSPIRPCAHAPLSSPSLPAMPHPVRYLLRGWEGQSHRFRTRFSRIV